MTTLESKGIKRSVARWSTEIFKDHYFLIVKSFVHLDQNPIGVCGPRAPKQQRTRG